ncbi:MAG: GumC family protein [Bacteroidota bacterium]|jgi:capsular exopolysaccharide synthesis family protein
MTNNKPGVNPNGDDIDLSGFADEIRANRWWFVASIVVFITLAYLYLKTTLPVYESGASVLIEESNKPSIKMEDFIAGDLFGEQANVATEKGILGSRAVMSQTIDELGIGVSYFNTSVFPHIPRYKKHPFIVKVDTIVDVPRWLRDIPFSISFKSDNQFTLSVSATDPSGMRYDFSKQGTFGSPFVSEHFKLTIEQVDDFVRKKEYADYEFFIHDSNQQIADMIGRLKIESPDKDATIVELTFRDEIPERAADVLNKLCEVYIKRDILDKTSVASLTLEFVDQQLDQTSKAVGDVEVELQKFKESNQTVNLGEESKAFLERLNAVDMEKVKSEITLKSLDNLLQYVSTSADLTEMAPSAMGIPDPLLIELITKYQELQSKRKSLSFGVKSTTPAVAIVDQQIADTRASLIENIKSIRKNIQSSTAALNAELSEYEGKIRKMPEIERQLLAIQRRFEVNQNIYIYLLQKKAETAIAKAAAISDNKVLDKAVVADEPVEPNKKLVLAISLILALLLPLVVIVAMRIFQTTVSSRDELVKLTEIPILGVIGHVKRSDNLVVNNNPKSRIAEAFRSVRTNLQYFGSQTGNKIIMVSSSVGGEGKSFVTLNLASILAMQDHKVIILGMDLRKPKLYQDFKLANDKGIVTYLIGGEKVESLIYPTGVKNLDIIPAGPVPPNPSELLAKPELESLFKELSSMYDFIIVDTPPLGIVSDAFLIKNQSHLNIYVVRENYSKREYIRSLNELVEQQKISNICLLLNDSRLGQRYGYGYGGYGYGYGGYGYYDDEQPSTWNPLKLFGGSKS